MCSFDAVTGIVQKASRRTMDLQPYAAVCFFPGGPRQDEWQKVMGRVDRFLLTNSTPGENEGFLMTFLMTFDENGEINHVSNILDQKRKTLGLILG